MCKVFLLWIYNVGKNSARKSLLWIAKVSKVNYCNNSYQRIKLQSICFIEPAHTIILMYPKRTKCDNNMGRNLLSDMQKEGMDCQAKQKKREVVFLDGKHNFSAKNSSNTEKKQPSDIQGYEVLAKADDGCAIMWR